MLIKLFRAVLDAQKSGNGNVDANPNEYLLEASNMFGHMTEKVVKSSSHSLKNREEFFEKLVGIIESGNIFAIVCGACQMLIEPNLPKKSKKKPQIQTQNEHLIAIDKIIHKTSEQFQSLQDFLKQFEADNVKLISEKFSDLNLEESSGKAELKIFIEESYRKTFMNLNSVIKSKIDHLRMLQL